MENKTEIEFTKNIKPSPVYTDSATEFILPDYSGDVRKILFTNAEVRPSGKFMSGDEVEFSGIVVYEVIYLDPENTLSSVSFTSDYDYSVKCSEEKYRDAFAETSVSNYSLRLIGPRKIAVKASVLGNVRVVENESAFVEGDTFRDEESPEVLTRRFSIRKSVSSENKEREYAESVARLDGAIADEVSVISTSADVIVEEISVGDGEVTMCGNLTISAIIKNGDAPAYLREKVVQFDESVPLSEACEGMKFIPTVTVTSLVATVNALESGTEVVLSTVLDFSGVGEINVEGEITCDAYLKSAAVDNKYEEFSYSELSSVIVSSCENESGSVQRSEVEAEGIREILFLKATPKSDSVVSENGKLTVSGEVKYSGVACATDSDGAIGYVPLRFSVPFERSFEVKNAENLTSELRLNAHSASATFDASKLYVTCALEISAVICEEKHLRRLSTSNKMPGATFENNDSQIVIYYPSGEEKLFDIAKKYRSTVNKIAEDNSLTAEVFANTEDGAVSLGVKKLLIY